MERKGECGKSDKRTQTQTTTKKFIPFPKIENTTQQIVCTIIKVILRGLGHAYTYNRSVKLRDECEREWIEKWRRAKKKISKTIQEQIKLWRAQKERDLSVSLGQRNGYMAHFFTNSAYFFLLLQCNLEMTEMCVCVLWLYAVFSVKYKVEKYT